jgi:hypothetical protein
MPKAPRRDGMKSCATGAGQRVKEKLRHPLNS